MTTEDRQQEAYRERVKQRALDEGHVLQVTAYLWFAKDEPGDDPLLPMYSAWEAARDIESVLMGRNRQGLKFDPLQIEVVDYAWGRIPSRHALFEAAS